MTEARKKRRVYVVPHSHVDLEWYWTHEEGERRLTAILDNVLNLMGGASELAFAQDQMALVRAAMDTLPQKDKERLKQAVDQGRLDLVGGMWVQPEVQVPHPEVLIRNIQKGQRWMGDSFGKLCESGWNVDSFGQIPQLPQILVKSGFKNLAFWRGVPPDLATNLSSLFFWESPDGSRILTHWMSKGYSFPFLDVLLPRSVWLSRRLFYRHRAGLPAQVWASEPPGFPLESGGAAASHESLAKIEEWISELCSRSPVNEVLLPLGGDNAIFEKDVLACIDFLNRKLDGFEFALATPARFFEAALRDSAKELIPTYAYDFCLPLAEGDLRGTWEGRCELKKAQRETENAILTAEKLAAIAWMSGASYPGARLNIAWEGSVLTSFHDVIGGSHTDDVYHEAMRRCGKLRETGEINEIAALVGRDAMAEIAGIREQYNGEVLAVFNPLPWTRSDFPNIDLEDGASLESFDEAPIASQSRGGKTGTVFAFQDIPAFGYRLFWVRHRKSATAKGNGIESDPRNALTAGPGFLENRAWKVSFDPSSGRITGIFSKVASGQLIGEGQTANEIIVHAHDGDLEGTLNLGDEIWRSGRKESRVESVEAGPLFARLRSRGGDEAYRFQSDTLLYRDSSRIDFELTLEVLRPNAFVRARFPLGKKPARIIYDTPYLARERPEGHFAAQNWAACEFADHGVALINTGNPGYWVEQRNLDLVLLWSVDQRKPPKFYNAPLAREIGSHTFRYSLFAYEGSWRDSGVIPEALQANCRLELLRGVLKEKHAPESGKSFLQVESSSFVVTVLKASESQEHVVIRGYETSGAPTPVRIELPRRVARAWKADLLERPLEELTIKGGAIELTCGPWEIATILAEPESR